MIELEQTVDGEKVSVPYENVEFDSYPYLEEIDRELSPEEESDKDYRKITKQIIKITQENLDSQYEDKKIIRKPILNFIVVLVSVQYVFLAFWIVLNKGCIGASDSVVTAYIVSVFAETFAGLMVIIKFAFDSKQETKLIEILNSVIENFQKFGQNKSNKK